MFAAALLYPLLPAVGYQLGKYEIDLAWKAGLGGFAVMIAYAAYSLHRRKKFLAAHPEVAG